jgi:hypothetical protein
MATLILRIPKGSPLTNAELDDNFAELDNNKIQLGGDIGGSTSSPVVVSLRGRSVSSTAPTTGQTLTWNGSAWIPQTPTAGSSNTAVFAINDVSNSFNNKTFNFTLRKGQTAITEGLDYGDNRDFTVMIGNRNYAPAVPQVSTLGPWIVDYQAERTYTFKVAGSKIYFYRPIKPRQTADIRINNVSASRQTRSRYPFSPNTIVFGD